MVSRRDKQVFIDDCYVGTAEIVPNKQWQEFDSHRAVYLENILNAPTTMAIIAMDLDFAISYYNQSAQRLFHFQSSDVDGRRLGEIPVLGLSDASRFKELVATVKSSGECYYSLERVVLGSYRLIEAVVSGIYDHQQQLMGFILNAQDVTSRRLQQERSTRKAAEEQCLGVLLRLSLDNMDVETFLQQSLESLLKSIPWLNVLPKGAIFLTEQHEQKKTLRMAAKYQLYKAVEASCNQIAFGYCVCGRVALQKELLFIADTHDNRHEVQYAGMEPHGHYSVPLLLGNDVLGVLTLYLPPGHGEKESDKAFLRRIGDVLSIGISKRQTESALEYEAQYDGLTTLPNRSQIILHIDRALARARRHGHIGAVMFIDLDHFKNINDSLGHNIGDEVLRQVSRRLVDTLRKEDMVARLGGDEFVVLLSEEGFNPRTVAQQAQLVAEKIRDAVSQTYVVGSYLLNVTPSIGIALFPENNETTTEVLQQADTAMYRAKAEGRNCTRFFLPVMQMLANERLTVEQDLRWALDEGKYQLYYQPQVDSAGSIVGAEVLLRCPGRDGNFNRIDLCIDVAESTGLILPIGEWILREACQKLKYWSDNGIAKSLQHLCINISPKQFLQRDFVSLVQRVINETNVDAQRIVLEITESSLIDAKMDAIETMKALKELGIRVAMDDFGTGYSSLSYITQLPLDILKIDRSFVSGISHDHKNAAVVEALMAMARQLDLYLIAEGVETSEDLEFLVQKGCKYFQGFHFSRPQSVNEFTAYMERHS